MLPPVTYREALPARELAAFVRRYWTTCGHAIGAATWHVLPDGCADVIFDLAAASAEVVGTMTRPLAVRHAGHVDVFGIRFAPGGLHALAGVPLHPFTDGAAPLGDADPLRPVGFLQDAGRARRHPRTMPTPRVKKSTPVLLADRIEPCIAFWERLGFEATTKAPEGDHLVFAILTSGASEVMYQTRASVAGDIPALGGTGAVALFVEVEDLAAVKAATASAPPFMAERTAPYGAREIGVRDPAGHYVIFAQFGG